MDERVWKSQHLTNACSLTPKSPCFGAAEADVNLLNHGGFMNIKKWMWEIATISVVCVLLLNPELVSLALFVDAVGLDIFLLLIEVQIVAVSGYYFHTWFKPILMPFYKCLLKVDPYFFIPTKDSVGQVSDDFVPCSPFSNVTNYRCHCR